MMTYIDSETRVENEIRSLYFEFADWGGEVDVEICETSEVDYIDNQGRGLRIETPKSLRYSIKGLAAGTYDLTEEWFDNFNELPAARRAELVAFIEGKLL